MSNEMLKKLRQSQGLPANPTSADSAPFVSWAKANEGDFVLGRVTRSFEATYGQAIVVTVEKSFGVAQGQKEVAVGLNYSSLKDVDPAAVIGKRVLVAFYGWGTSKETMKDYRIIKLDVLGETETPAPAGPSVTMQERGPEAPSKKSDIETEFETLFSEEAPKP
jgi:hypothetical protein